jgi:hypothetical protein
MYMWDVCAKPCACMVALIQLGLFAAPDTLWAKVRRGPAPPLGLAKFPQSLFGKMKLKIMT